MEKVSSRKQTILDVIDEQIETLEAKLRKAQPFIDELHQLRRTRATLLSEKSVTGNVRNGTRLTMESVIQAFRELNEAASVGDLAEKLGVTETVIRSHLNRYRDERYRTTARGWWELIGNDSSLNDAVDDDEDA